MNGRRIFTWLQLLAGKIRTLGSSRQTVSPVMFSKKPQLPFNLNLQSLAHRYEGKLLLQEEIPLPDHVFHHLLSLQLFTPLPSINTNPLSHQCARCNNKQAAQFAKIPCLRCQQEHIYCRNCIEMGRILACEFLYYWSGDSYNWPKHHAPCSWKGSLTPAQQYASMSIAESIERRKRKLVWAVTGAGKTEMLFHGITKSLMQGLRICIASPRADVVRELTPRLQDAFRSIHIQGLYSGSRDNDGTAQLIISTTHQLFRYRHAFDVLIIDEIDAFPYHSDKSLQFAADRAKKKNAAVIYLTATPREKQRLQIMMKKLDYIFVPVRFHGQPLIIPKWVQIHTLQKELKENSVPEKVQVWLKNNNFQERQLLIFIPTIRYLKSMLTPLTQFLLDERIIPSANYIDSVHAEDVDRKEKVDAFRNKSITVLLTTTILERGVTFPSIDVIVLDAGHQVFDEAALVQIAGRVGRSPEDPRGEVVLFHDGKTEAMVRTNQSIKEMNRLQKNLPSLQGGKE